MNITNINVLIRFNKTRQICPSVTQVLSILLKRTATGPSVERANRPFPNSNLITSIKNSELYFERNPPPPSHSTGNDLNSDNTYVL